MTPIHATLLLVTLLHFMLAPSHAVAGEIEAMNAASRASGTAPLSVFFDALDPASGVVQAPGVDYLEYDYHWDFGDPNAGAWERSTGGAKNTASGFVAAHVFREPGEYVVNLTVRTSSGSEHRYQQTISVDDGSGWTNYYVSSSTGSDGNSGTSPDQPFASLAHAMSHSAPNTRILFRRGDTFSQTNGALIGGAGPRLIGAYGEGPRPVIRTTGTAAADSSVFRFAFSGLSGWRFVDLDLRGNTSSADNAAFWGIGVGSPPNDLLLMNLDISGFHSTGIVILRNECDIDHLFIVDTRIRNVPRSWAAFVGSNRLALIGNDMDKEDTTGSHTLRVPCTRRGVIAHNLLASAWHSTLKLHAEGNAPGTATEDLVISDNRFHGSNWQVALGPQDAASNESVRRILYERNVHRTIDRTGVMLHLWTHDVLVRNNVFIAGSERDGDSVAIQTYRLGVEPGPERNRILHNTFYNAGANGLDAIQIGRAGNSQPVVDTTIRNNLVGRGGAGWVRVLFDFGVGQGTDEDDNQVDEAALFEDADAGNFRLDPASPAIDAVADVGVREDFDRRARDDWPDAGAFEFEAGSAVFADGFESEP